MFISIKLQLLSIKTPPRGILAALAFVDNTGARPFLWRTGGIFNLENDVFLIFRDYTKATSRECGFYVARAR